MNYVWINQELAPGAVLWKEDKHAVTQQLHKTQLVLLRFVVTTICVGYIVIVPIKLMYIKQKCEILKAFFLQSTVQFGTIST